MLPSTIRSARSIEIALVLAALAVTSTARAQDPTAAALFHAGKELTQQGNYKDACPKFEASYKREIALGTLMNLADCHEKTGVIALAWSEWGTAYEMARKTGDTRSDLTKRRQDALEPRLPKLKVSVTGVAPDLAVWRDERGLDPLEYEIELPVEPGKHVITVRRGKDVLESEQRDTPESAHVQVTFDLAKIAAAHPAPIGAKEKPLEPIAPPPKNKRPWQAIVGPVAIGVGAAGVVAGLVLEAAAIGLKNNHDCASDGQTTICTQAGLDKIDAARSAALAGPFVFVSGAALAAAGIVILILAPKEPRTTGAVVPIPGGAALTWGGTF